MIEAVRQGLWASVIRPRCGLTVESTMAKAQSIENLLLSAPYCLDCASSDHPAVC